MVQTDSVGKRATKARELSRERTSSPDWPTRPSLGSNWRCSGPPAFARLRRATAVTPKRRRREGGTPSLRRANPKRIVHVLKSRHTVPHFYVGVTGAVHARLAHHNAGSVPHTARHRPWTLHVVIEFADERPALRFERAPSVRARPEVRPRRRLLEAIPKPRSPASRDLARVGRLHHETDAKPQREMWRLKFGWLNDPYSSSVNQLRAAAGSMAGSGGSG